MRLLSSVAMGIGILIGFGLAVAGMGDPGPGASAPAHVQLLPLSGLIVIGALVAGIRIMGRLDSARDDGEKLIAIGLIVIGVALWIALAAPPTRGLAAVLAVIALLPFAAGCVLSQSTDTAGD
jgi:hypothetical protein